MRENPGTLLQFPPMKPSARACFRADLNRYLTMSSDLPPLRRWVSVATTAGVIATAVFRFGQYTRESAPRPVRWLARVPLAITHNLVQVAFGIHLFAESDIGPGLYIGHYGGIWIAPGATLGSGCNIAHGVTIGKAGGGQAPVLGDRVWVGPGAIISGAIRVESDAVIGANSLVATHVPEKAVVVGVPARVVSKTGSGKLVQREA